MSDTKHPRPDETESDLTRWLDECDQDNEDESYPRNLFPPRKPALASQNPWHPERREYKSKEPKPRKPETSEI